jgi:antitoxin (DNA-binding transcriptional repressor) of toxin-antitoxin stability system
MGVITMSLSELRAALPSVLSRVEEGEEVTVTRHGKAIAVLVRPDVLRRGRNEHWFAKARELRQMLEDARTQPLSDLKQGGLSPGRAEELIAQIRADRDSGP